jgi:hypothetical protein
MAPLIQEIIDWTVLLAAALAPLVNLVRLLWQLRTSTSVVHINDDREAGEKVDEQNDHVVGSCEGRGPREGYEAERPGFEWLESKVDEHMACEHDDDEAAGTSAPPRPRRCPPPLAAAQNSAASSAARSRGARQLRRQSSEPQLEQYRFVQKYPGVRGRRARRSHEEFSVTVPPLPTRRQSVSLDYGNTRGSNRDGSATTEASIQPTLW